MIIGSLVHEVTGEANVGSSAEWVDRSEPIVTVEQ